MLTTVQPGAQRSRPAPHYAIVALTTKPEQPHALVPLASVMFTVRAERDAEIVGQGDPARYCYLVVSGCVRTVKLMEDGRRQVGEFLLPGDWFGWDALEEHDFAAEAVTSATLHRYPRRSLDALADCDGGFARQLRTLTAAQLRAARDRVLLLGRKTASERIASFLLEMADRTTADRQGSLELPMSRADIADYLGLTIETVCRGLTQLRQHGTIAVDRAQVVIRDRRALGASCELVH